MMVRSLRAKASFIRRSMSRAVVAATCAGTLVLVSSCGGLAGLAGSNQSPGRTGFTVGDVATAGALCISAPNVLRITVVNLSGQDAAVTGVVSSGPANFTNATSGVVTVPAKSFALLAIAAKDGGDPTQDVAVSLGAANFSVTGLQDDGTLRFTAKDWQVPKKVYVTPIITGITYAVTNRSSCDWDGPITMMNPAGSYDKNYDRKSVTVNGLKAGETKFLSIPGPVPTAPVPMVLTRDNGFSETGFSHPAFTFDATNWQQLQMADLTQDAVCGPPVDGPGPLATLSLVPSAVTTSVGTLTSLALEGVDANKRPVPVPDPVTWTSSNTQVATVSGSHPKDSGSKGSVTALGPGTATITASVTVAGKTISVTTTVYVVDGSSSGGGGGGGAANANGQVNPTNGALVNPNAAGATIN